MQSIETVPNDTPAVLALEDDDMASRSSERLLITAAAVGEAEARAKRIHDLGFRRRRPFVRADAPDLPIDIRLLREVCLHLLDDATGGTLYINAVEEMPATVQDVFVELLGELELARDASTGVRLVSGTSVSLLDRVAAGTFAERLFYRLNVIHLIHTNGGGIAGA